MNYRNTHIFHEHLDLYNFTSWDISKSCIFNIIFYIYFNISGDSDINHLCGIPPGALHVIPAVSRPAHVATTQDIHGTT